MAQSSPSIHAEPTKQSQEAFKEELPHVNYTCVNDICPIKIYFLN